MLVKNVPSNLFRLFIFLVFWCGLFSLVALVSDGGDNCNLRFSKNRAHFGIFFVELFFVSLVKFQNASKKCPSEFV